MGATPSSASGRSSLPRRYRLRARVRVTFVPFTRVAVVVDAWRLPVVTFDRERPPDPDVAVLRVAVPSPLAVVEAVCVADRPFGPVAVALLETVLVAASYVALLLFVTVWAFAKFTFAATNSAARIHALFLMSPSLSVPPLARGGHPVIQG
jgi:hypothetical protein